jgi:hypothetical protein
MIIFRNDCKIEFEKIETTTKWTWRVEIEIVGKGIALEKFMKHISTCLVTFVLGKWTLIWLNYM